MSFVRNMIGWLTYPVGFGATLLVAWWGIRGDVGRGYELLIVPGVLCALSIAVLLLQRIAPKVDDWRHWRRDAALDVAHGLVSTIGGAAIARLSFFGIIAWLSSQAASYGWGIWPDHWPLFVQLPLALVVSDFIVYNLHRASHRFPALWRLHELHHTSERLYALSSGRTHLVYVAISTVLTTAPLLALGADPPILALLSVTVGANGILQHSNIDLRCKPWAWLLATADMHRWHHAVDPAHQNTNFGNTLSVWDRLYGSYDVPEGVPDAVGLGEPFPRNFAVQLVRPFLPRRAAQG